MGIGEGMPTTGMYIRYLYVVYPPWYVYLVLLVFVCTFLAVYVQIVLVLTIPVILLLFWYYFYLLLGNTFIIFVVLKKNIVMGRKSLGSTKKIKRQLYVVVTDKSNRELSEILNSVLGGSMPLVDQSEERVGKPVYEPSNGEISALDAVYGKVEYDLAFSDAVDKLFLRYSRYSSDGDRAFFLKRVWNIK